ncbi:recombination protein RecR [Clostridiales bacterium COT073_COT-073]|nr:recombination protein RecR [Clostridiales bacterium COT073_COT-073]
MDYYGKYFSRLIEQFGKLPGIGYKSARRLAFHVISMPEAEVEEFARAIMEAKKNTGYCKECFTITDEEICPICASTKREPTTIMVVEETKDLVAYEKTGRYQGLYHVLGGVISPMLGIGPGDIRTKELFTRLRQREVQEIILATGSTVEGEATAIYLSKLLKPIGVKVTRIANGVPVGGDLEYVDEMTLTRALEGRTEI